MVNRWIEALLKPSASGLLDNCSPESYFTTYLENIVQILEAVFLNKEFTEDSPIIQDYIIKKRYIIYSFY
jgi:hypothetical protein